MKKMLIIAAAVLCAVVSQAAQVAWTASELTTGGGDTLGKSAVGYLFNADVTSASAISDAIKAGKFSDLTPISSANMDPEEDGYIAGAKVNDASLANSSTYNFVAVVFDSGSPDSGNFLIIGPKSQTLKGSGSTTISFGSQADNKGWQPVSEVVPEPCSVALIALGLAAFGLKRKVA